MSRSILVTGGTGFIGSHVIDLLLDHNYKIILLKSHFSNTSRIYKHLSKITILDRDTNDLEDIFLKYKPFAIIHLATLYKKSDEDADFKEMYKENVEFPKKLVDMAIKHKTNRFLNTSTFFQYSTEPLPISEDNDFSPFNYYAKTKIIFSDYLKELANKINTFDLILYSPFGPRDNEKLVTYIIKKALMGDEIILSEGFQRIDLTYVKDIAIAYLKCLNIFDPNIKGYVNINIASGIPTSIRELVMLIEMIENITIKKSWGQTSTDDFPLIYADITKAKSLIGWEPEFSLKSGLIETIEYNKTILSES